MLTNKVGLFMPLLQTPYICGYTRCTYTFIAWCTDFHKVSINILSVKNMLQVECTTTVLGVKNNLNIVIILYGDKKEKMQFLKMLNIISSKRCFIRAICQGNQAIVCKENTMYVMSTKILQQTLREHLDSEYHADQGTTASVAQICEKCIPCPKWCLSSHCMSIRKVYYAMPIRILQQPLHEPLFYVHVYHTDQGTKTAVVWTFQKCITCRVICQGTTASVTRVLGLCIPFYQGTTSAVARECETCMSSQQGTSTCSARTCSSRCGSLLKVYAIPFSPAMTDKWSTYRLL